MFDDISDIVCLSVYASAMRDLFVSMERAGGSFPPIMMLNVLHMCFPQFAQKNDQGVFQQQVPAFNGLLLTSLCLLCESFVCVCVCECIVTMTSKFVWGNRNFEISNPW